MVLQLRVLAHQRQQGKTKPRVIGDVVVSHDDRVASVGRFEAKPQVAAHADRVTERDGGAMCVVERLRLRQQLLVSALVELEVRRRDQDERFGVVHEPLAAAVRSDLYRRNAVRTERQCEDGSWELTIELDLTEIAKLLGRKGVNLVDNNDMARKQRVA